MVGSASCKTNKGRGLHGYYSAFQCFLLLLIIFAHFYKGVNEAGEIEQQVQKKANEPVKVAKIIVDTHYQPENAAYYIQHRSYCIGRVCRIFYKSLKKEPLCATFLHSATDCIAQLAALALATTVSFVLVVADACFFTRKPTYDGLTRAHILPKEVK
jgi:hypothetical protein